jgi:ribonuclease HI
MNVYTDGSCSAGKGGYGVVIERGGEIKKYEGNVPIENCTNQKAELYAIYVGLTIIEQENDFQNKEVIILTDSKYCIGCFTEWIQTWSKNNWKTASNKPVCNLDLIYPIYQLIYKLSSKYQIYFQYVKAHNGNEFNELADKLANRGRLS